MKTLMRTAVIAGVTYLMNNPKARQRVMNVIKAFANGSKAKQPQQPQI